MNGLSAADQRAEDLDLLEALVNAGHLGPVDEEAAPAADLVDALPRFGLVDADEPTPGLTESEAASFRDMHERLLAGRGVLSAPQRQWAERRAAELSLSYGDPARRNRNVPVGHPVQLLVDSMPKPLRPPVQRRR